MIRVSCGVNIIAIITVLRHAGLFRRRRRSSFFVASSLALQRRQRRPRRKIAIVGGGPSGIFSSIFAAETVQKHNNNNNRHHQQEPVPVRITVYESGPETLAKVRISGGGRCNVMHDASKPVPELLEGYPRGSRELTGLFASRFTPAQMRRWFEDHIAGSGNNNELKTEADGRMFPVTDSSRTIVDALLGAVHAHNAPQQIIEIRTRCKVQSITKREGGGEEEEENDGGHFEIEVLDKNEKRTTSDDDTASSPHTTTEIYDAVVLATGSAPFGYSLARSLGHTIVKPVPSLFTLSTKHDVRQDGDGLLHGLAGLSVPDARISYLAPPPPPVPPATAATDSQEVTTTTAKRKKRQKKAGKNKIPQQDGPLLITHSGLSGPAALRLSAFGAREMAANNYKGRLAVNWAPSIAATQEQLFDQLWKVTTTNPKKCVSTSCPLFLPATTGGSSSSSSNSSNMVAAIPKRLWSRLVKSCGIDPDKVWGEASKKSVRKLSERISDCRLEMTSKGRFKDEFVTAGGVSLKEVNMRTMESRICKGLFFCGELLDVDGITGGYNFMNCWGTGNVAGISAGEYVLTLQQQQQQQQQKQTSSSGGEAPS